jgi:hypothetical protein
MKQRWALVLLGAWTMGSIGMSLVATQNFYTVDRLLASPSNAAFAAIVQKLGPPAARELLRFLSSELNRLYFQVWNVAQVVLGLTAWWLVSRRSAADARADGPASKIIAGMLAVVVLMLVYLTPAIVSLGRELDFVPRDPAPPGMSRFWVLHAVYTSLEMLKLAAGVLAAALIARRSASAPAA